MSANPYAPPGESTSTLRIETASLTGTFLQCTFYGIEFLLYFLTAHYMIFKSSGRIAWGQFVFITLLFILCTVSLSGATQDQIAAYVWNRNYPGGPTQWAERYYFNGANGRALSAGVAIFWLQDALILYRFFIIYGSNYYYLIVPGLMYVTSVASSLVLFVSLGENTSLPDRHNVVPELIFWGLSISLNVLLTSLIVGRLLYVRRTIKSALGEEHSRTYLSVAAMLVESAALVAVFGIILLVVALTSTAGGDIAIGTIADIAAIAPTLIVYRVSQGRAWTSEMTRGPLTTMVFPTDAVITTAPTATTATVAPSMSFDVADSNSLREDPRRDMTASASASSSRWGTMV